MPLVDIIGLQVVRDDVAVGNVTAKVDVEGNGAMGSTGGGPRKSALPRSRSRMVRAAKKRSRRKQIVRSTLPLCWGSRTPQSRGATQSCPAKASSSG